MKREVRMVEECILMFVVVGLSCCLTEEEGGRKILV